MSGTDPPRGARVPVAAGRLVALALLLLGARLQAQSVELQLREDPTRSPVAGAIVRLVGDRGVVAQGLTTEQGRVTLRAPGPGQYRLRADRIGFNGQFTAPFELAAGQTLRTELALHFERRVLPTLTVSGRSRCAPGGEGGPLAAALWEEIRTALTANLITQRLQAIPLHVREFQRELDRKGTLLRAWVFTSAIFRGQPFASLPPSQLARRGFVEFDEDSTSFAAPDAALLLSDEFVGTHCFRAVPGAGELVGLAFEPVPGRRVPEVKGTLWVDRPSSELRFLEYGYIGLPDAVARSELGGRVEFRRLTSGAWIVGYWHIRMPNMGTVEVRGVGNIPLSVARLTGYIDRGGRAEVATDTSGRISVALLRGRVYDSTLSRGLAGAVVHIADEPDSVMTGADGRYELVTARAGPAVATLTHPKLTGLARSMENEVVLSLGDTATADFAVPGLETIVRGICGPSKGRSGVVGLVWGPGGFPLAEPSLRVSQHTNSGGTRQDVARTGPGGLFGLCDLPPGPDVRIQVMDGPRPVLERRLRLPLGTYLWADLRLGESAVAGAEATGPGVLTGVVRNDSTGQPIPGVEVVLEGTGRSATTGDSGSYVVSGIEPGRRIALFRGIGYRPVRQWVELLPGDTTWADAGLMPTVRQLDPVEVKAEMPGPKGMGREAFEERRKLGFGRFIDSTTIRRMENHTLADLLRGGLGIQVVKQSTWRTVAASRRKICKDGTYCCYMQIILDGVILYRSQAESARAQSPPTLEEFDLPGLESVEVYPSAAETPIEFGGSGAACGTIVLWSRRGP